ncbi:hypothetical protein HGQ85_12345 [Clostridioides difficile]|nr:hypothetical protein [Clostridioides difficile]
MKNKSSFRQTVVINTVKNIPIILIKSTVALMMPLCLIYFIVSMIVNLIASKLVEKMQARKYTNYNIENG